jgi:hypothetical protein
MLLVLMYFASGVVARWVMRIPVKVSVWLNRYVVWLALPALILAKLPAIHIGTELAVPMVMAWTTIAASTCAVWVLGKKFAWPTSVVGALLLIVPLGNTSFLGIPVVTAILGKDHVPAALAFDQLGTFLALATWGSLVSGRLGSGAGNVRAVVKRLFTFPPFLALLLSLVVRSHPVSPDVQRVLVDLGKTVAPVAMASIGMRVVPRWNTHLATPMLWGLGLKMVAAPLLVATATLFGGSFHQLGWSTSILEAGMPPMVTAGIVAISAGFDEELVTDVVGVGTVVALVILPIVAAFV